MWFRIFVLGLISILIFSCTQISNKKKQEQLRQEQLRADSIAEIKAEEEERLEKARQDSIIAVEQEKVIGEIVFGMTEKVAKSKINKFKYSCRIQYKIGTYTDYKYCIGEYEYSPIRDYYYEGKLYKLLIHGMPIFWEYYESEVPKQIKYITDVIEQKYDKPDIHNNLMERYELGEGYSYLINQWNVGRKRIEVRIEDSGRSYSVNVSIFLPEIDEKIQKSEEQKIKESTEKAKDVF